MILRLTPRRHHASLLQMHDEKTPAADGISEVIRSDMIRALLRELTTKLTILATDDSPSHIDIRRLPLPPGALEALRAWLGSGEIEAKVTALGTTTIQETGIAGVWWIRHARSTGDVFSEHLEISRVPELLAADPEEVTQAAESLRSRLLALESPSSLTP